MPNSCTVLVSSLEETSALACAVGSYLCPSDIILLSGDLGAGKTHFSQALAKSLGITEQLTSPTFNIVLEYHNPQARLPLFHFDLYRLNHADELDDIGFFEICESEGVSCIEWADKFLDAMPEDHLDINIQYDEQGTRYFTFTAQGERWKHDFPALIEELKACSFGDC